MKKNRFNIINLIFLCVLVSIFAVIPTINLIKSSNIIKEKFMGKESSYQGVITIWNVDTFEAGSQNKSEFLLSATTSFSKNHSGLYFLVENITPQEMINSFLENVYPDVISFGVGVQDTIRSFLSELNLKNKPRDEILNSAVIEGRVYAAGYLMGGYILATTETNLIEAGLVKPGGVLPLTTSVGFDKKIGKKTRHVSNVVVGENKYINPIDVLEKCRGDKIVDYYLSDTMYDAYLDFVSYNKGSILFGTQRDLYKLSGRVKVGKIDGVVIDYLEGFTNLVQYIGVLKNTVEEKKSVAEEFINYLLTDDIQSMSTQVGMVNTIRKNYYENGEFSSLENILNKDLVIPNIFN